VDVATRNVRVRATLANSDGRLRPGMFANVEVLSAERRPVLTIPATAVMFAPYGDSVYVLGPPKAAAEKGGGAEAPKAEAATPAGTPGGAAPLVAQQRFVRLGERRGDLVAVLSGLSAGETVVGSGAFKLRNGVAVVVKNDLAPDARLAPQPTNP
jgi:membrane fusion protein (multidrug efflux system)